MDHEPAFCPVQAAIDLLQEKWTLHIIRGLLDGPRGFNELARAAGGCNPATLSQRLERLVEMGIVEKTIQSHMPPRTSYALTRSGQELKRVIDAIERWARRYLVVPEPGRSASRPADADAVPEPHGASAAPKTRSGAP